MIRAQQARRVLADCRLVHRMLEDETDPDQFRIMWVGAVSLLRAVGHVLDKVDAVEPTLRASSSNAFKHWKDASKGHVIFTEFIEKSRNLVLKEYEFQVDQRDEIPLVVVDGADASNFNLSENLFRPLLDGYGAGEDGRDVYAAAIDWWEEQLTLIEAAAI
ncbi:hypothetical protein GA830_06270 [Mesorhizobium sp. NBSH29]|uniref:hypothetical protein n=1 Tax=Mesorhizobium sp. NBSH29 TaxID=2654249 RepID=UPI0018964DCD|nr:hypothetical protein [Mesorhizobium sp. NBSH29]QPC86387.1 hypothetical protein GA830_06270 [Mesorhizobium sp. NBSH29]